jgi:hypothetical protein
MVFDPAESLPARQACEPRGAYELTSAMSSSSSNTPAPHGRTQWMAPLKTMGVIGVELFFGYGCRWTRLRLWLSLYRLGL